MLCLGSTRKRPEQRLQLRIFFFDPHESISSQADPFSRSLPTDPQYTPLCLLLAMATEDLGNLQLGLAWAALATALVVVLFRLYSRIFVRFSAGWDDWTISFAVVSDRSLVEAADSGSTALLASTIRIADMIFYYGFKGLSLRNLRGCDSSGGLWIRPSFFNPQSDTASRCLEIYDCCRALHLPLVVFPSTLGVPISGAVNAARLCVD